LGDDSEPSFSVIVPVYQAADAIRDALTSVFTQSLLPREVIVCDYGSTDDIDGALAPFSDLIALLRKPGGGEAAAKNVAARAASGGFVLFLDARDVFLPGRLEALCDLSCALPDLDILTTDAWLVAANRHVRRCYTDAWPFEWADQRREILRRNFIGAAAVRRERLLAAGGFDESLRRTADWDLWIRLLRDGARAGAVLEPLARYRVPGSAPWAEGLAVSAASATALQRGH
jgi:glycosyltransferase involved in cell wall biosynthesis